MSAMAAAEPTFSNGPAFSSFGSILRAQVAKPLTRLLLAERLDRACAFLQAHSRRHVTLSEVAGVAGLSQFHLARHFKAAFGESPISYHRRLRLGIAERVLAQGGVVAEAAEAAGYSDAVSLTHAFRRHHGLPPQRWLAEGRAG
jgi:AraC-like DNA-binding protein